MKPIAFCSGVKPKSKNKPGSRAYFGWKANQKKRKQRFKIRMNGYPKPKIEKNQVAAGGI